MALRRRVMKCYENSGCIDHGLGLHRMKLTFRPLPLRGGGGVVVADAESATSPVSDGGAIQAAR